MRRRSRRRPSPRRRPREQAATKLSSISRPADPADDGRDRECEQRDLHEAPPRDPSELDGLGKLDAHGLLTRLATKLVDIDLSAVRRTRRSVCPNAAGWRYGNSASTPSGPMALSAAATARSSPASAAVVASSLSTVHEELIRSGCDRPSIELDEPHFPVDQRDGVRIDPVVGDPGGGERAESTPALGERVVVDRVGSERAQRARRVPRTRAAHRRTSDSAATTTSFVARPPCAARSVTSASCSTASSRLRRTRGPSPWYSTVRQNFSRSWVSYASRP